VPSSGATQSPGQRIAAVPNLLCGVTVGCRGDPFCQPPLDTLAGVLPDDIDPELWFASKQCGGQRDYLYDSGGHTWPGRMSAYCPHEDEAHSGYRISVHELPDDLPTATRYWVRGFMAGNLPEPRRPDDRAYMERWDANAKDFVATGLWDTDLLLPPSAAYQVRDWLRCQPSPRQRLREVADWITSRREDHDRDDE